MEAFESVSTWRQPMPPPASAGRTALIATVAGRVAGLSPGRLRVAVDGRTGAGIYLAEVHPQAKADVLIDNRDFTRPAIIGPPAGG